MTISFGFQKNSFTALQPI